MEKCCGTDADKKLCDQVECKVTETPEGVQVKISAKDPKKTGSLKALLKACRGLCGCC